MAADYLKLIDERRVREVLADLVRIPSVNPGFPGGHGEKEVAAYVTRFFERLGLPVDVQTVEPDRDNVIGTMAGSADLHLLWEAHMDTVQTSGMTVDPFGAEVRDGKLYGRGACDTKASLAAMLVALETMAERRLVPAATIHLAAVVDEEITYKGVSALAERIRRGELRCDAAIVGEPTQLHAIIAHKGVLRFRIEVTGAAAHSSTPEKGVNAIECMADVIAYLKRYAGERFAAQRHPLTGPPTLCISRIEGGVAPNTVAERCSISVDIRTAPGQEWEDVWTDVRERLAGLEPELPAGATITVHRPFLTDYAMEVAPDDPLVLAVMEAANAYAPDRQAIGAPYCSDASKLTRVSVPTLVFGPGDIAEAHTAGEWVELAEVVRAAAVFVHTAMHFAGRAEQE
ncbi:M20 family metallopeptidase [Paenibacillus sp. GYB003]|uniref:M20 family metallopeptidase n=1 Tax=Paenibacillus sp. GYB003 TaxID=2994392 RepID=UPI002F962749